MDETDNLPEPPQEPASSDCCGTGCSPCVFDIYERELALWKTECERIQQRGRAGISSAENAEGAVSPDSYRTFQIEKIHAESHDSNVYRFTLPENSSLDLQAGQHLIVRWKQKTVAITRQYTPISRRKERGFFDVVIKLYENGAMSQCVRTWRVGDLIEWRGFFGSFTYKPNTFRTVMMLAAGTGIAPMISVIREIVDNDCDETFIHLIYACKRYHDILCKAQLDDFQQFWNFRCTYVLSQEAALDKLVVRYGDKVHCGRIDEAFVRANLTSPETTLVLICGTKSFDKDMINYVVKCGLADSHYFMF